MGQSTPATSTVRNEQVIDPTTQAWRNALFSEAGSIYNQGAPGYYPGQTVTDYAPQTWQGLDMLQRQAEGGAPNYQGANDAAGRMMSGENPALPYAQQFAAGESQGQRQLAAFAPGAENPYLDQLYQQGASRVTDGVNAQFAGAGRFGANAAYGKALAGGLGDLYTGIYAPAYEAERNRSMQAASTLLDSEMGGASLLGSTASAANADALRAIGMLPSIYDYGSQPGQALVGVGGAYEGLADEYLRSDIDRFNYEQNAGWGNLGRYANIINGLPDFSGQVQTSQGARPNRAMSALGGAATGASVGSAAGPWGTAIGAGLGALSSLYG